MSTSRNTSIQHNEMPSLQDFQWLVSTIRKLRPDLCKLFQSKKGVSLEFARWLVSSGTKEYQSLKENRGIQHILSQPIHGLGLTPLQALIYLDRKDVQEAYPLALRRSDFLQWFYRHGIDEHELHPWLTESDRVRYTAIHPKKSYTKPEVENTEEVRPFGVNLIGYAYGQLGIGEDMRMTAKALKAAEIPFVMLNFPPGKDIPQNDRSMEAYVQENGPYNVNIFCMTALETARYYAEHGEKQFRGRYNIGYWPWELGKWPEEWRDLVNLVDEVWVSSRHTYDALAPVSPVPVLIMPLAVEIDEVSSLTRKDFSLPEDAYLFCFSFDLNSSIYRKNPQACLRAFQRAFPTGEETPRRVGLVIKTHRPVVSVPQWENLKQVAASDMRIHIIEQTLSRPDVLALYGCCNCFMSLHRAEGFGRGIAEALLLGLHVITTGYSGNMDFCRDNFQVDMIGYHLVPVHELEYPFGKGQFWAEIEEDDVIGCMRQIIGHTQSYLDEIRINSTDSLFSTRICGRRYSQRLYIINSM